MVDFKGLLGNFILATIIIVGLFAFIVINQGENDAEDPLINDQVFNDSFSGIMENIGESTEEAEDKYGVFNTENPKPGFASIVLFGIVSVGKTFSEITFGFFTSAIKLPLVILGIPPTVYNLILTWLIVVAIVSVWLLYKLGS